MLKQEIAKRELKALRSSLYADLYQRVGDMDLCSVESLSRRIHVLDLKLYSFKGGASNEQD